MKKYWYLCLDFHDLTLGLFYSVILNKLNTKIVWVCIIYSHLDWRGKIKKILWKFQLDAIHAIKCFHPIKKILVSRDMNVNERLS